MTVAEIPADQVVEMTEVMHRAFRAGGCNPICHCCCTKLPVGSRFHLATVDTYGTKSANCGISLYTDTNAETREVMLCADCDVAKMNARTAEKRQEYEDYRAAGGGCHRVNGQIVH